MTYIKATDRLPLISSNDVVVIWRGRKYIASYNAAGQYFSGDFGCLSANNSDWEGVKWLDESGDCDKRKESIAFLDSVTEEGCNNYFRIGQSWFLGDENDEDPEGPFTSEQLYDLYLQSLTS